MPAGSRPGRPKSPPRYASRDGRSCARSRSPAAEMIRQNVLKRTQKSTARSKTAIDTRANAHKPPHGLKAGILGAPITAWDEESPSTRNQETKVTVESQICGFAPVDNERLGQQNRRTPRTVLQVPSEEIENEEGCVARCGRLSQRPSSQAHVSWVG